MPSEQAAPVAPVATPSVQRPESAFGRALRHPTAPVFALLIGTLIIAAVMLSVAVRVTGWALDETVVKQSAVHYVHGLPGTLFHDLNARATSRLFSLLLMPVFGLWEGDVAVRIARGVSALCFCSTSIPVFFLARRVLRSQWAAVASALLAITGPWILISTTLYTENLAFPLFVWAVLAMVWAVDRPGVRSDLVVAFAIGLCVVTRVQLFALFAAWLIVVWVLAWSRNAEGGARGFVRGAWSRAPVSHVTLGVFVLFALLRIGSGHFHADVQRVLGAYSELQDRGHLSADLFLAIAYEVQAMVLPAFLAAVAALAWLGGALRSPRNTPRWAFAVVAVVVVVVLYFVSAYVQGGFLGENTEERYFLYAFPFVWIGAFAALEEPPLVGPRLFAAGAGLIVLFATLGQPRALDTEAVFLAPSAAVVRNVLERVIGSLHIAGLTTRDAVTLIGIVLLALGIWAWHRGGRRRFVTFIFAMAGLQLAVTGYAVAARTGHVPGIASQTGGDVTLYGWVDRHAGGRDVTFLNNQLYAINPPAEGWQYPTLLWNSRVRQWAQDPEAGVPPPIAIMLALPGRTIQYDEPTGYVKGLERAGPFVSFIGSPFFQIAGGVIAKGPGNRLELMNATQPVHALWRSRNLEFDGAVRPDKAALFDAWIPPGSNAKRLRISLTLQGASGGPSVMRLTFGDQRRDVPINGGAGVRTPVFDVCAHGRHVSGEASAVKTASTADNRPIAGRIDSVKVEPLAGGSCR